MSAKDVIIAIDVGTSGTKMVAYDLEGVEIVSTEEKYPTFSPHPGWREQSAENWWGAVVRGFQFFWEQGLHPEEVIGIGLSGQMENCLLLDHSGTPLGPVILYSDSRAIKEAAEINEQMGKEMILNFSGNILDSATTAAKLQWMKKHQPERFQATRIVVSGAKDFVAFRFTGIHVTDPTNASTTGLMNIHSRSWERPFIESIDLSTDILPPILSCTAEVGRVNEHAAHETGLLSGCPVFCGMGDAGAANLGAGVVTEERAHCYLGTTGWIATLKNTYPRDRSKILFTLCGPETHQYLLIAPLLNAGRAYDWALQTFEGTEPEVYQRMEEMLPDIPCGCNGLLFLPSLAGERSPHRDPKATGVFFGITEQTTRLELIRATLEGISFGIRQVLKMVAGPNGFSEMILIGGGSRSRLWAQILADICNCTISVPSGSVSSPCLGAAFITLMGLKKESNFLSIDRFLKNERTFHPHPQSVSLYDTLFPLYTGLYPALKSLFQKRE
ncbi:MAG: FGGY family carbohydrate kinase [Candidatus Atribacteria bacterium]|nr:FGGY family carbohydrate kinase [Candidatus Atribacteria bacterium]